VVYEQDLEPRDWCDRRDREGLADSLPNNWAVSDQHLDGSLGGSVVTTWTQWREQDPAERGRAEVFEGRFLEAGSDFGEPDQEEVVFEYWRSIFVYRNQSLSGGSS